MALWVAIVLGLVEGITEYLPISSTGHLILMSHLLGEEGEAAKSFDIVIQLGAILAVLVQYRALLGERLRGLARGTPEARRLFLALLLGFLPAALVGVVARKWIKAHLFGSVPVAVALIVGGLFMLLVERLRRRPAHDGESRLEEVTPLRGLFIGLGQTLSLVPGTSRSMTTIVSGQLVGLSTATAAEFSFLLALPTLGAATLYEAYKARHALGGVGAAPLVAGLLVSFFVAWAVIAGFIAYLKRRGLSPFGLYRILLGALVLWLLR